MKTLKICIILCLTICLNCGCSSDRMVSEVTAWNEATERTMEQYNKAKDTSLNNQEALLNLFLFDKIDDSVRDLFVSAEKVEISENGGGMPEFSFIEQIEHGISPDNYDSYLSVYMDVSDTDYTTFYDEYKEYRSGQETKVDFDSFLYDEYTIETHNFFTSLETPTVTEIYRLKAEQGLYMTITVLWHDGKIKYVNRGI